MAAELIREHHISTSLNCGLYAISKLYTVLKIQSLYTNLSRRAICGQVVKKAKDIVRVPFTLQLSQSRHVAPIQLVQRLVAMTVAHIDC